jgi:hypothetical protein
MRHCARTPGHRFSGRMSIMLGSAVTGKSRGGRGSNIWEFAWFRLFYSVGLGLSGRT